MNTSHLWLPPVPQDWQDTLSAVAPSGGASNAYIAGGALRDLVLGLPPKDIDIFVDENWSGLWGLDDSALFSWAETPLVGADHFTSGEVTAHDDERYPLDVTIRSIYEVKRKKCPAPFQVIVREGNPPPAEMLEKFDFGICRIAWSTEGWLVHRDFLHDYWGHIFTARRSTFAEASLRRAQRFSSRFQGWDYDLRLIGGTQGTW